MGKLTSYTSVADARRYFEELLPAVSAGKRIMLVATLIFLPIILIYTAFVYRVMRGKVTVAQISANEHTAY